MYGWQHQLTNIMPHTHKCFTVVVSAERQRAVGCMHGLISCQQGCWDAARQPACMITKVCFQTHSVHTRSSLSTSSSTGKAQYFRGLKPNSFKDNPFFQITPSCHTSIETLGVSKSISLLGLKLKDVCRNVNPKPQNHNNNLYICVNYDIYINIVGKNCVSAIFFVPDITKKFPIGLGA